MKKTEIMSGEYKLVESQSEIILITNNLDQEIAFSFYSKQLQKAGLARNLPDLQIKELFENLIGKISPSKSMISVDIIGGDESKSSKRYAEMLVNTLSEVDNDRDIINIRAFDVGHKKHPNPIFFDANSNLIHPRELLNENILKFDNFQNKILDSKRANEGKKV